MRRSKAYRRFQDRKAKRKSEKILTMLRLDCLDQFPVTQREIGRFSNCHRCPCSCYLCGNPRKYGELTLAETRIKIKMHESLAEYQNAA